VGDVPVQRVPVLMYVHLAMPEPLPFEQQV
jgi:hypothetical protein